MWSTGFAGARARIATRVKPAEAVAVVYLTLNGAANGIAAGIVALP